tara:strand:+ start:162 stop:1004 length:843 start_codon:yes stop_codon:yes gene_type:complete
MWFDIIRKKITNMQVVKDILISLNNIFYVSKKIPNKIKNRKFNNARSTFRYIEDNLYVMEYDSYEERNLPKVKEISEYIGRINSILINLTEWYNSVPKQTKRKSRNLFKEINKELNEAKSLFIDSDFEFVPEGRFLGRYYPSKDTSKVNLPIAAKQAKEEEKLIEVITDTLNHEFGHQASRNINSDFGLDSFFEEMLAYLVQYPNDKQKAFKRWLIHPNVIEAVEMDGSGRRKEVYDEIKSAVKSGVIGKKNRQLYDDIILHLSSVMDLQTNPTSSIQYN